MRQGLERWGSNGTLNIISSPYLKTKVLCEDIARRNPVCSNPDVDFASIGLKPELCCTQRHFWKKPGSGVVTTGNKSPLSYAQGKQKFYEGCSLAQKRPEKKVAGQ